VFQFVVFATLAMLVVLSAYVCATNWSSPRYQPQT
jgi:hypothetical protein